MLRPQPITTQSSSDSPGTPLSPLTPLTADFPPGYESSDSNEVLTPNVSRSSSHLRGQSPHHAESNQLAEFKEPIRYVRINHDHKQNVLECKALIDPPLHEQIEYVRHHKVLWLVELTRTDRVSNDKHSWTSMPGAHALLLYDDVQYYSDIASADPVDNQTQWKLNDVNSFGRVDNDAKDLDMTLRDKATWTSFMCCGMCDAKRGHDGVITVHQRRLGHRMDVLIDGAYVRSLSIPWYSRWWKPLFTTSVLVLGAFLVFHSGPEVVKQVTETGNDLYTKVCNAPPPGTKKWMFNNAVIQEGIAQVVNRATAENNGKNWLPVCITKHYKRLITGLLKDKHVTCDHMFHAMRDFMSTLTRKGTLKRCTDSKINRNPSDFMSQNRGVFSDQNISLQNMTQGTFNALCRNHGADWDECKETNEIINSTCDMNALTRKATIAVGATVDVVSNWDWLTTKAFALIGGALSCCTGVGLSWCTGTGPDVDKVRDRLSASLKNEYKKKVSASFQVGALDHPAVHHWLGPHCALRAKNRDPVCVARVRFLKQFMQRPTPGIRLDRTRPGHVFYHSEALSRPVPMLSR